MENFEDGAEFGNRSEIEINKADEKLRELATYEIAQGKIVVPSSLTEYSQLQAKIAHKFNYFKYLIRNGEMTLDELSVMVKNKFGAFPVKCCDANDVDSLINDIELSSKTQSNLLISTIKPENNLLETILNAFGHKSNNPEISQMYNEQAHQVPQTTTSPKLPLNIKNSININSINPDEKNRKKTRVIKIKRKKGKGDS